MSDVVMVTGASGFTGRWFITEAIKNGFRCVSISNSSESPSIKTGIQNIGCDLTNY